jgi:putative PIN family toxin of toxin-antitoxin system
MPGRAAAGVIVFDASTLVSATFRRDSIPARAVRHALRSDRVAVSEAAMAELLDVLHRPGLARFLDPEQRAELIGQLFALGAAFAPRVRVTDCRDAKDNKYLELALASGADAIVSSDADLLVLHPWRGVRLLRPADYLAEATGGA